MDRNELSNEQQPTIVVEGSKNIALNLLSNSSRYQKTKVHDNTNWFGLILGISITIIGLFIGIIICSLIIIFA